MRKYNYNYKIVKNIFIGLLLSLAIISIMQGSINAINFSQDSMWPRIKALLYGVNPYNQNAIKLFYQQFGYDNFFGASVHYFPSALYVMAPLALINNILISKWALLIFSLMSTFGLLYYFYKLYNFKKINIEFLFIVLLFLSGVPFRNSLGVGQNGLIAVFFLMVSLKYRDNQLLSGFMFSFSLMKYTLTGLFIFYFLKTKKYLSLFVAGFIHLTLHFLAMNNLNLTFFELILQPLQSSGGLVSAGFADYLSNIDNQIIAFLLSVTTLLITLTIIFSKKLSTQELISLLTITTLMIVYHRLYDYFILILMFPVINNLTRINKFYKISFHILLVYFFIFVRFLLIFDFEHLISFASMLFLLTYYILMVFMLYRKPTQTLEVNNT